MSKAGESVRNPIEFRRALSHYVDRMADYHGLEPTETRRQLEVVRLKIPGGGE